MLIKDLVIQKLCQTKIRTNKIIRLQKNLAKGELGRIKIKQNKN